MLFVLSVVRIVRYHLDQHQISHFFGKDKGSVGRGSSEVVDQIKLLNKKIDQLVEMISANGSNKKKEKSEVKTDVEVKEPVKTVEKKEEKKPKKEKKPAEKKTKKVKK